MTKEQRVELYDAWNTMDQASLRMMTAQVSTASLAAERLEAARAKLREVVFSVTNF